MKGNLTNKLKKNVFSLTLGRALSLLINFFSITIAARYLGVNEFGVFASILALVFILSKIVDFGFVPIVFRELSKKSDDYQLLNNALTLRFILFLIVVAAFDVYGFLIEMNINELYLSNIFFINIILSGRFYNFRELLEIPFKVHYDAHIIMYINIVDNIVLLILVLFIPYFEVRLSYFVIIYCVSNLPGFVSLIYLLYKKYSFRFKFSSVRTKWLLSESTPLLGFVVLNALFQQVDILILKNFDSEYSAGLYSAATRLTMPLSIIPVAIMSSVFPIIVQKANSPDEISRENNLGMYKLILKILFLLSFSSTLIISFKAKSIIIMLFGIGFQDAWLSLIILFCAYVFLFYNFFMLDLLTAINKQKFNFNYSIIIVIVNVLLSFLLIWDFSLNGIAAAKLFASIGGAIYLVIVSHLLRIKVNFFNRNFLLWSVSAILSAWLFSYLNIIVYFILIIITLFILILKLHFFNNDELLIISKLFNNEKMNKLIFKIGIK